MDKIILHISDLHVTLDKPIGGGEMKGDSYLTTQEDTDDLLHYVTKFTQTVKSDYDGAKIYLLITGDIANSGERKEYLYAETVIEKIIENLNIQKENVLLIPGDHDINRRDLTVLLSEEENSSIEDKNIEKFKRFSSFYKKILNKEFNPSKIIFDTLEVEDKILLLGINSCYNIDLVNKLGYLPIGKFEEEFKAIEKSKTHQVIACWHHNFLSSFENKNNGQWNTENRIHLLSKLEELKINFVFTGNEHTNNVKDVLGGNITCSDSGTFSSINYYTTFKIYKILISDDIELTNEIYALQKTNGNDEPYFWDKGSNSKSRQSEKFTLYKKEPEIVEEVMEISANEFIDYQQENISSLEIEIVESRKFYYEPEYSDKIYQIIRNKKLFHTGHFHWSETSRAHNWIDISKLLESRDDLYFVNNAILNLVETFELQNNCDLVIGLGYEGNIISSKVTIKYDIPYTYLPYSYRYKEHHKYEKELGFNNESGKYKNILIITDVVNDGRTIRKLINDREKSFFENVQKVIVISLIYTGHENVNTDILNFDYIKEIKDFDLENDYEVNKIEFYTVKALRAEKCPYGKNYKTECLIYKDDLSCVNLFYEEDV